MGSSACKAQCCSMKDGSLSSIGDELPKLDGGDTLHGKATSSGAPGRPPKEPTPEEYSIVLDKKSGGADSKLGIDVDYVAESESLPVRAVTGGLVGMWNKANPDKQVVEHDHIIEVNGERQVVDVLMDRLRDDSVLKITLRRVGRNRRAICELGPKGKPCRGTAETGAGVTGTVTLSQINSKLCRIEYDVKGLTPGLHGFHVHEKADFSDGCTSAGPHYNPFSTVHGGPESEDRHVGDLGNIEADMNGVAQGVIMDHLVTLEGQYSVAGRSIVVKADPDDLGRGDNSQPGPPPVNGKCSKVTGNAGARIACGEIKLLS